MIRQIRYFQAVVRAGSFSDAAEACHISQSAISQQIKALERELGCLLLERHNRSFTLTPAGAHFYRKSLVLLADFEQLCTETAKIAHGDSAVLKIGYLRNYNSPAFHQALAEFAARYPRVELKFCAGNHEELFDLLRAEDADLVLSDQRRAFSEEYVNLILATHTLSVELAAHHPLAELSALTAQALKNLPCILVATDDQRASEQEFYQTVIGIQSDIRFAENLEDARLMVASSQGFLPVEESGPAASFDADLRRIPLYRNGTSITRNCCLFWKKNNSGYYIEEFAEILKSKFA